MVKTIFLEVTTIVVAVSGFIYVVTALHWPSCLEQGEKLNHLLVYISCCSNAVISLMGATAVLKSVGYRLSYTTAAVAALVFVLHVGTMVSVCWERIDPPIKTVVDFSHSDSDGDGQLPPDGVECPTLHRASTIVVFLYTVFGIATSFSISFKHYNMWDRYVTTNTVETPCMSQGYRVSHPLMIKYLALRGRSSSKAPATSDTEAETVVDEQPDSSGSRKKRHRQILGTPPVKIVKRRRNVLATGVRVSHPLMTKYPALRGATPNPTVAPCAPKMEPMTIDADAKDG